MGLLSKREVWVQSGSAGFGNSLQEETVEDPNRSMRPGRMRFALATVFAYDIPILAQRHRTGGTRMNIHNSSASSTRAPSRENAECMGWKWKKGFRVRRWLGRSIKTSFPAERGSKQGLSYGYNSPTNTKSAL